MNLIELLTESIKDPKNLLLALNTIRDLADGNKRLDAKTRGRLQVKILELEEQVTL